MSLKAKNYLFIYSFIYCLFAISWAAPVAYGGLTAMPDPQPIEQGQGPNPQPHGS